MAARCARIAVFLLAAIPGLSVGQDRTIADTLVERSIPMDATQQEPLLREALALCPNHAEALNNLGLLAEQAGQLDAAEILYLQAIDANPGFIAAYAGIADVLMAQGRYRQAAGAYDRLLDKLAQAELSGTAGWLLAHKSAYESMRNLAQKKADLAPTVVSAQAISRSLTAVKTRAIGTHYKKQTYIDLPIRFGFNSTIVDVESTAQMGQVSRALNGSSLKTKHILIEGHTDDRGSGEYNQRLSERRAEAVRRMLVRTYGLPTSWFETRGFGESRPVAPNDTEAGRTQNRRVTFVNLVTDTTHIQAQHDTK